MQGHRRQKSHAIAVTLPAQNEVTETARAPAVAVYHTGRVLQPSGCDRACDSGSYACSSAAGRLVFSEVYKTEQSSKPLTRYCISSLESYKRGHGLVAETPTIPALTTALPISAGVSAHTHVLSRTHTGSAFVPCRRQPEEQTQPPSPRSVKQQSAPSPKIASGRAVPLCAILELDSPSTRRELGLIFKLSFVAQILRPVK